MKTLGIQMCKLFRHLFTHLINGLHTLFYQAKSTKTRFQLRFKVIGIISSVYASMLNVGETRKQRTILGIYCVS